MLVRGSGLNQNCVPAPARAIAFLLCSGGGLVHLPQKGSSSLSSSPVGVY